jgi:microcin C transport system substrate-binding protein
LKEIKDKIPPEIFTRPYKLPVNNNSRDLRRHLRRAMKLLDEAGWKLKGGWRFNEKSGEPLKAEFLLVSPAFERVVMPYVKNLQKIGVKANVRLVDSSQYTRRTRSFDFDIIIGSFRQSLSPGNEQRDYWGSAAANAQGSRNLIGIRNKAVDWLIDKSIFAPDRAELVAACRALDRVLLWNQYVAPQWYAPYERIAYWRKFAHPETLPSQEVGFLTNWWIDEEAARNLKQKGG